MYISSDLWKIAGGVSFVIFRVMCVHMKTTTTSAVSVDFVKYMLQLQVMICKYHERGERLVFIYHQLIQLVNMKMIAYIDNTHGRNCQIGLRHY